MKPTTTATEAALPLVNPCFEQRDVEQVKAGLLARLQKLDCQVTIKHTPAAA